MEALAIRGFLTGLASSSPSSLGSALVRLAATLLFPLTGLASSSTATGSLFVTSAVVFDLRGTFLGGWTTSSDKSERSLPGDSALTVDREAAARFGLAGEDMMRYLSAGRCGIWRSRMPLIKGLSEENVVYDCLRER